jgi:ABC-type branched-subunit amino acid transport system substrate-binding protein
MSYESSVEPIKLGYLNDITSAKGYRWETLVKATELVFREGYESGMIDRPVEIIYREVEGLPKGNVKVVAEAFEQLVEAGCLAVIGPSITENGVPTKATIERLRVPAITLGGSEEWMGEWTFGLPMGSLTEEPRAWARLIAKRGLKTVGVLSEAALIGETYLRHFRAACRLEGIRILVEETIPQTGQDLHLAVERVHAARPDALVYSGFGLGLFRINEGLAKVGWDPPRFMGTSWQMAFATPELWNAIVGWIGLDMYDEGNPVGQAFLDRFEAAYGYRPQTYSPLVRHDLANLLLHAFADAQPLSPQGVKQALERVKLLPAACGAPGTRLSFGRWNRRAWVGADWIIARELDADGVTHRLVDRAIFK